MEQNETSGGKGQQAVAERSQASQDESQARGRSGTFTVTLPFVTAEVRRPEIHVPTRQEWDGVARDARSLLPSPKSLAFLGGLTVTAVAGIIDWPVAAAIGVGTAIAGGPHEDSPSGQETRQETESTASSKGTESAGRS